ncbi:formin-like protein 13 [Humulus lupulus]|uniref:formin-like protein 13 n=1 Tax=Humulus lupulus TaxID=3486 RepID=UPI002B40FA9A|nr:formin-like protein 13 [Humulus lupulus]
MGFHFPYMLAFLSLVFAGSYGVQYSPELYWKSVLPNTPMPKAVTDLLQSGKSSKGRVSVNTRHEGKPTQLPPLPIPSPKLPIPSLPLPPLPPLPPMPSLPLPPLPPLPPIPIPPSNTRHMGKPTQLPPKPSLPLPPLPPLPPIPIPPSNTRHVSKPTQFPPTPPSNTRHMGKPAQLPPKPSLPLPPLPPLPPMPIPPSNTRHMGKPTQLPPSPIPLPPIPIPPGNTRHMSKPAQLPPLPITLPKLPIPSLPIPSLPIPGLTFTTYAASSETQLLHDNNPNVALFFLEKDIQPGTKMMSLDFIKSGTSSNQATFLPRQEAQSIPFSSKKVPQILNQLSLKPQSVEAEMVKQTIKECEAQSIIKGEEKYCATSLESMIDFTTSKLGKNVQAISTQVESGHSAMHNCTITQVEKKRNSAGSSSDVRTVACHKQNYPFAVFYCHTTQATEAYVVTLVGADGTKAKAVAACHKDTSQWNPNYLAFQILKVKPGTVPICHFLPEDHIVWIQN